MTKTSILVVAAIPADLRQRLQADYDLVDLATLKNAAAGATADLSSFRIALTTSMAGADDTLMASIPQLGLIACNGAGLDKIDLAAAARHRVAVTHTPDVLTEDTADFAIALLYATARRTVEADRFVRAGRWMNERMPPSRRIFGKTIGVVGLGKIGSAVARRAVGLGLHVAYNGRNRKSGVSYDFEPDLARLAERSDVLVLCCSGGDETRHLVNRRILEKLGGDGILINISRGSVVDEPALIDALQSGLIASAGLDVFASEPALDERFLTMENVVVQPHYACITQETRAAMIERIRGDIAAFVSGGEFYDAAGLLRGASITSRAHA